VNDTRLALGQLAAAWRARFAIPLIGITGSNGKTTVKEMCAAILRAHFGGAASRACWRRRAISTTTSACR
jgi:UDP-N-acetylmuramoyl-tripeptide--D-alanyl-D-alanine ligase